MFAILKLIGSALMILVLGGGFYLNSQRTLLVEKSLPLIEEKAAQILGVPVKVGNIDISQINIRDYDRQSDLIIHGVEVLDKHKELLAHVDTAAINFKLIALRDDPVAALDAIKLDGVTLNLKKRDDNSWNFNDLKLDSEGESTFDATIFLERGTLNADFDGKSISAENISAQADCANLNAISAKFNAKILGAQVTASGTLGKAQQVVNVQVDEIFFDKILPFLPADKIPDAVEILGGSAENISVHALHTDDALTYLGSAQIKNAAVKVEATDIKNIGGTVTFNEREIFFDAAATANDQFASASGSVRIDTDEPFLDIRAESDNFTPAAVLSEIGIVGAANVRAHMTGTAANPHVDAEIFSKRLGYENLFAENVSTKLRYAGDMIYLNDISADIFGGNVAGTAQVKTADLSFNANVKANALDAATLCDFADAAKTVHGKIFADLGLNGNANELDQIKVYGSAQTATLDFEGFRLNDVNTSFYFADADLTLDYLSAKIPNGGTLGAEGTVKGPGALKDNGRLDLNFYGAHIDIALAKHFNDNLDMSGLADFKGTVRGDTNNPDVTLLLSAVNFGNHEGKIFNQPFDSIKLAASGSLDGVHIDDFALEKDGKLQWTVVEGSVGLTGNKNINVQLETAQIRAENIIALIAPELELTGNVSNTLRLTGTLDNLKLDGNLKFNRGMVLGNIINTVDGDYSLDGNTVTLQNFVVTSPMIDMILDGTITLPATVPELAKAGTLDKDAVKFDLVVTGNDINLQRFKSKLPDKYNAEGHVKFLGNIKGSPARLVLDGESTASAIYLNGVALNDVYGHFSMDGSDVYLNDFQFRDGIANCRAQLKFNLDTEVIGGELNMTNAGIANLFTIFDIKNELVDGRLNSKVLISGTLSKPQGSLTGEISQGTFAGYDIRDIKVDGSLVDNLITVKQLEGKQGDNGALNLKGTVNLRGALDLSLQADDIALGMFSKAAGFDWDVVGTTDIGAKLTGTFDAPFGEVVLNATGGIKGSTFDSLDGHFLFKNQIVDVSLSAERELAGKTYGASMTGTVPVKALFARTKDKLPDDQQLNLNVSLDGANLSLLPVMSKLVAWGVGALEGNVKITGTAAHPQFNGQITLNDGSVKVKGMKSLIEHINVAMRLKGESFDIENFSGNIGGGTFAATGGFRFPGLEFRDYNFDFAAVNLNIDSELYKGLFNANFNVSEGQIFRHTLPKLSGQINLDKCRIGIPPIPDSDDPLPDFIIDVWLNLGDKVHLYSSNLCDMFLTGSAHFEGTTTHPKTSGSIYVKRGGTLTYIESVFNIREGEAQFNQIGSLFPSVHFFAETKVDRTKIFLDVRGTVDNLKFLLTSSPEMSREEIIQLLTLRDAYSKDGTTLTSTDALAIGLRMTILSDIEDVLKRTLGIDQLTVSRGSGSMLERHTPGEQDANERDKDYNVKFGKYINDKFMLRYTRGFGSHKVNRYGLQYDFNDNFGLTLEREGKDYIISFEARYKF